VIVIGNPTGLMGTVSDGIISAFRENHSMIQLTAPISHGSSGSPVMDETGQVIGVATSRKRGGTEPQLCDSGGESASGPCATAKRTACRRSTADRDANASDRCESSL